MDNYYNSVNLTEQLLQQGVYTCGTLRLQRGAAKELQLTAKKKARYYYCIPAKGQHFCNSVERQTSCFTHHKLS